MNIKDGSPLSVASSEPAQEVDYHITKREKQILQMVYDGHSNKSIADTFGKSIRTVETHRFNIMKKLEVGNITELLRKIDNEPYLLEALTELPYTEVY